MKTLLALFLGISTLCFSYTQDFVQSMDFYWMIKANDGDEKADKYLTYLIHTEYTPNIDKINYMMYKQVYYYQIDDIERAAENKKMMDALCEFDPACLEEKNANWAKCVYRDDEF